MNAIHRAAHLVIGQAMLGGFFAGSINLEGQEIGLIVSPKTLGDFSEKKWNTSDDNVEGATSYFDGLANTKAMAEAGSEIAKTVRDLRIGDFDDWYIPSQDELEILYRNFKPIDDENSCYARSGINLSALPPTRPYTEALPAQTEIDGFKADQAEAFNATWYWSSTQHAADADFAWCQDFSNGLQYDRYKGDTMRVRAVRRFLI